MDCYLVDSGDPDHFSNLSPCSSAPTISYSTTTDLSDLDSVSNYNWFPLPVVVPSQPAEVHKQIAYCSVGDLLLSNSIDTKISELDWSCSQPFYSSDRDEDYGPEVDPNDIATSRNLKSYSRACDNIDTYKIDASFLSDMSQHCLSQDDYENEDSDCDDSQIEDNNISNSTVGDRVNYEIDSHHNNREYEAEEVDGDYEEDDDNEDNEEEEDEDEEENEEEDDGDSNVDTQCAQQADNDFTLNPSLSIHQTESELSLALAVKKLTIKLVHTKVIGSARIVYEPGTVPERYNRAESKAMANTDNSLFYTKVTNGASYRTCRNTPFHEIINLPWYGNRRPPHPYSQLIALALICAAPSNHVLKIEDIYEFIAWRFPFFSLTDPNPHNAKRWKSAVRHNLSFSCSFQKVDSGNARLPGGVKRCLWGFSEKAWQSQLLLKGHRSQRYHSKH
ncbi:hypothetical protein V1512DRAFT_268069 [Lipomyces arxii]|uniref:uncharacterized protein n=1 Tax=Lipomyces arxii TaxID=56418 RepID=UPI0034CD8C5A